MLPNDTSPQAYEFQLDGYRRMTLARKGELVVELSEAVRELARAGIRARHPEYDEETVRRALVSLLYGPAVVRRIWPDAEPARP